MANISIGITDIFKGLWLFVWLDKTCLKPRHVCNILNILRVSTFNWHNGIKQKIIIRRAWKLNWYQKTLQCIHILYDDKSFLVSRFSILNRYKY